MATSELIRQQINAELSVMRQLLANFENFTFNSEIQLCLGNAKYTDIQLASFLYIILTQIIRHNSFENYNEKAKQNLLDLQKFCQSLAVAKDDFAEAIGAVERPNFLTKKGIKLLLSIICNYHKHPTSSQVWPYCNLTSFSKRIYFHALVQNINYSVQKAIQSSDRALPSLNVGYSPNYHVPATHITSEYNNNPFCPL